MSSYDLSPLNPILPSVSTNKNPSTMSVHYKCKTSSVSPACTHSCVMKSSSCWLSEVPEVLAKWETVPGGWPPLKAGNIFPQSSQCMMWQIVSNAVCMYSRGLLCCSMVFLQFLGLFQPGEFGLHWQGLWQRDNICNADAGAIRHTVLQFHTTNVKP